MPGLPAKCVTCGLTFVDNGIVVENSTITLSNGWTRCPRCGGSAKYVEGQIRVSAGRPPELLKGPAETRAIFERFYGALASPSVARGDLEMLAELADAAKSGALSPEVADAAATQINTRFKGLLSSEFVGLASILLTIVLFFLQQAGDDRDQNELILALERAHSTQSQQLALDQEMLKLLAEIASDARQREAEAVKAHVDEGSDTDTGQ